MDKPVVVPSSPSIYAPLQCSSEEYVLNADELYLTNHVKTEKILLLCDDQCEGKRDGTIYRNPRQFQVYAQ